VSANDEAVSETNDGHPIAPAGPETDRGKAMFEELLWVHSAIRRDLQILQQLAADVGGGLSGREVQDALRELKSTGPLWQLRVNCLRYCRFVHALRAANPTIGSVVDRLEADHARVSDLLDAVEAAAAALRDAADGDARRRLIDGLGELRAHLLEHLDYEELRAGPTLRRLERLAFT
jgi:hypothetical protein